MLSLTPARTNGGQGCQKLNLFRIALPVIGESKNRPVGFCVNPLFVDGIEQLRGIADGDAGDGFRAVGEQLAADEQDIRRRQFVQSVERGVKQRGGDGLLLSVSFFFR